MKSCRSLLALFLLTSGAAVAQAQPAAKHNVKPNTVWKGEIRQDGRVMPTIIYFNSVTDDRIKGEIHFRAAFNNGESCQLSFQGNVIDGRTIVWITDKKAGNVTFPGLYFATLENNTISGTWQVPSARQYDQFTVKLVEEK